MATMEEESEGRGKGTRPSQRNVYCPRAFRINTRGKQLLPLSLPKDKLLLLVLLAPPPCSSSMSSNLATAFLSSQPLPTRGSRSPSSLKHNSRPPHPLHLESQLHRLQQRVVQRVAKASSRSSQSLSFVSSTKSSRRDSSKSTIPSKACLGPWRGGGKAATRSRRGWMKGKTTWAVEGPELENS